MVQFEVADIDYWEQLAPPQKPGKPSPWDNLLQQIEDGKIVRVSVETEKEKKGSRIGISRRARSRGFKVEFREDNNWLVIRKSEEPLRTRLTGAEKASATSAATAPTGKKRGRKPKSAVNED
jgi:hypothetical protein